MERCAFSIASTTPPLPPSPRPLVGFSDITPLHQAIALHAGVATFHGPMVNLDFNLNGGGGLSPDIDRWLWDMLAGEAPLTRSFGADDVFAEGEATACSLAAACLDHGIDATPV